MPKPKQAQALTRDHQRVVIIVVSLVGLASSALALLCAIAISTELSGWYCALEWSSTPAQMEHVDLRRTATKGGARFIEVRYRYVVDDTAFTGSRVGWNDSAWVAISSWHQLRHDQFVEAGNLGQPMAVWYDPQDPASSVLDRGLRWGLLVFMLLAGLLTSLLGWAASWLVRQLWFGKPRA